jgi:two-component system chemotaxis response regulator CheY
MALMQRAQENGSHVKMETKVLVVDDSAIVRQQVGFQLAEAGFQIVEAVDGQDALEKLEATKDIKMILCDVLMPRMNGIEFLTKLSEGGILKRVPVVMLTTEGQPELIARAKCLGAKAWMVKPVKPELLVAAVKKLTNT